LIPNDVSLLHIAHAYSAIIEMCDPCEYPSLDLRTRPLGREVQRQCIKPPYLPGQHQDIRGIDSHEDRPAVCSAAAGVDPYNDMGSNSYNDNHNELETTFTKTINRTYNNNDKKGK
jgi:hypothetical protein